MKRHKRDTAALFDAMVMRHRDMLWSLCISYRLAPSWTVEDAFQQVLETLWVSYPGFKGHSSERTWVYRVADRTLQRIARRTSNRQQPLAYDIGTLESEGYAPHAATDIYNIIDSLDEPDRTIVRCVVEGYSCDEIALNTGLTTNAVSMRLSRVRKKIKSIYYGE